MASGRRYLWIAVALALLSGFAWLVLRPHEPVFEGTPLSVVLHEAGEHGGIVGSWASAGQPARSVVLHGSDEHGGIFLSSSSGGYPAGSEIPRMRAERALRTLGTNALPVLVKMAGRRVFLGGFWSFVGEKARDPDLAFLHLPPQWDKPEVSCWAMRLLGAEARPAVPALVRLLNSRYPEVRDNAAMCLAGIGPAAEEAVPALVQALRIPKGATPEREASAWFAAYALGEIGPAAGAAAAALEELTNDAALPFLRNGAAIALIKLRRGSFQTFFDRLKDTSEPSKWEHVAWAVSGLGTNADPAIPLLLAGIEHSNDVLRWAAIKAIGRIHRQPGLCLGPLASVLDSRDDTLRWLALNALGNFGPAAKPVAAEVVRCLTDRNGSVRGWATNALRLIEPDARKTVGP